MKTVKAGLLDNVVSIYDQTKTTTFGRAALKTISGEPCIGPPLTKFIDVFTDTGLAPVGPIYLSSAGFLYAITAISGGLASLMRYSFNLTTGATTYLGRVVLTFPNVAATTHTIRGLKVDDSTSNIRAFIATTGSVAINGGLFMANQLVAADFAPIGPPTIPMATGSDQKAVYFLQNSALAGSLHVGTSALGINLDPATTRIRLHNGSAAVHQFYEFNYSTAPNNPGSTITITNANPGVVTHNAHGYAVNDPIFFTTTGAVTGLTTGTVYFVRNPTANTYELSATSGGASINTTGTQSGVHTIRRAFGTATNLPLVLTGNLPALTGTALQTNSEDLYTPDTGPNAGFLCAFFGTTTNAYEGRVSELTAGVTSWPSLRTVNLLGSPTDIITPTAQFMNVGDTTKQILYVTGNNQFIAKPFQNSVISQVFGTLLNRILEGVSFPTLSFGISSALGCEAKSGWFLATGSATGQRGIMVMDYQSHSSFDFSSIISPVVTLDNALLEFIHTSECLFDFTGVTQVYYRTSGFGVATGGWVELPNAESLNAFASGTQIQFKILFDIANQDASTPAQIAEILLDVTPLNELSDNWIGAVDHTTQSGASPSRTGFRMVKAYAGSVPKLYFRAYDDAKSLVAQANTVDNPGSFEYSTNGGTTWLPLGTIPNVALTTLLRYNWTSPPGVQVSCSLREA